MVVGLLPEWAALDVWEGRLNSGAAKFFASYALAERVLPSGDAAYAIGGTGYLLGMTALRGLGEAEVTRAVALADDSGDLKARASTRVTAGMYFTIMGQPARALPQLEAAQAPAERLGAGLWKHRSPLPAGRAAVHAGAVPPGQRRVPRGRGAVAWAPSRPSSAWPTAWARWPTCAPATPPARWR